MVDNVVFYSIFCLINLMYIAHVAVALEDDYLALVVYSHICYYYISGGHFLCMAKGFFKGMSNIL